MNIIVFIRLCHPYCQLCTQDSNINACSSCTYTTTGAKLSGSSCSTNCLTGYGDDINNRDVCLVCQANCKYCQDTPSNCLDCIAPYLLFYVADYNYVCVNPCPSHYYSNMIGNNTCLICDSTCVNCYGQSYNCTSCQPA